MDTLAEPRAFAHLHVQNTPNVFTRTRRLLYVSTQARERCQQSMEELADLSLRVKRRLRLKALIARGILNFCFACACVSGADGGEGGRWVCMSRVYTPGFVTLRGVAFSGARAGYGHRARRNVAGVPTAIDVPWRVS